MRLMPMGDAALVSRAWRALFCESALLCSLLVKPGSGARYTVRLKQARGAGRDVVSIHGQRLPVHLGLVRLQHVWVCVVCGEGG